MAPSFLFIPVRAGNSVNDANLLITCYLVYIVTVSLQVTKYTFNTTQITVGCIHDLTPTQTQQADSQ